LGREVRNKRTEQDDDRKVSAVLSFGGEGISVHTNIRGPPVRLQVGHGRRRAYKMACFKQVQNCNGTSIVSQIVMASFRNVEIIMAQI